MNFGFIITNYCSHYIYNISFKYHQLILNRKSYKFVYVMLYLHFLLCVWDVCVCVWVCVHVWVSVRVCISMYYRVLSPWFATLFYFKTASSEVAKLPKQISDLQSSALAFKGAEITTVHHHIWLSKVLEINRSS